MFKMATDPSILNSCFQVDVVQSYVEKVFRQQHPQDLLRACLLHAMEFNDDAHEVVA